MKPVSEKFGTGTDFVCQNLGIEKIYNGYRYRIGTGTGNFFLWYRNRYRKNFVPEKSLGTGIGKIWYRKKVSEPVSEKIVTGKIYRNRYWKYWVPEKVSEPVSEKFGTAKCLGTGIGKIWYRKKVSENFGTGTDFRRKNLGISKIYNGYRYRKGTGIGNFSFFLVV